MSNSCWIIRRIKEVIFMTLVDFSYLMNLFLTDADELAKAAVSSLQLGIFEDIKRCSIALYRSLPQELQGFIRDAENPQIPKNQRLFKKLSLLIELESYI